jgi:plasmid replication initiation protein
MGKNVTDVGLKKDSTTELKKHAATIHCSNTLSLLQRKISNALLYHAYQELMAKEEHEISVKQLCRLIGYQGNNHAVIKDALRELISTVIEWNLIDAQTGVENWTASSIIASVSIQGPHCYYAYSPRMKQLLHSPSMFGKIDLIIQSHFRSSYGLALYENCIRYRGLPYTKWFEMDLFKKLMGVPPGMYGVFRDFKRRVLDKAVDEVNTYSDLVIAAECIREGRKVARVRFKLKERAKKARLGLIKEPVKRKKPPAASLDQPLIGKLTEEFGLSQEQIQQLMKEHDMAFLQEKMQVIETSKAYQSGKVSNVSGLLLSAVRDDYKPPAIQKPANKKSKNNPSLLADDMTELKRQIDDIRQAYHKYREQVINDTIQNLPKKEKDKLMKQFLKQSAAHISTILKLQRSRYSRANILESPQIQALLRQFALREIDFGHLLSLEQFVEQQDKKKRESWKKFKVYDALYPFAI